MSEFTRGKITFAIGLLAALFALAPFLMQFGSIGFDLLGFSFSLKRLYGVLAGTLALAVYCYGFQFVSERKLRPVSVVGDTFYVIALVLPAVYLALLLLAIGIAAAKPIITAPRFVSLAQNVVSALIGALGVFFGVHLRNILEAKQRSSEAAGRESQSFTAMRRAERLLSAGSPDLAIVEAFRALEVASAGIATNSREWYRAVIEILPKELRGRLEAARQARNAAAHTVEPISVERAREAIDCISKVLAILADHDPWECPRCGNRLVVETGSDHGYTWSRKRCRKCDYVDAE